jgi:hypothetical protein
MLRVKRWRRAVGLTPELFTEIPRRQPRYKRYHRIAEQIRQAESELLAHLAGVNNDPGTPAREAGASGMQVAGAGRDRQPLRSRHFRTWTI